MSISHPRLWGQVDSGGKRVLLTSESAAGDLTVTVIEATSSQHLHWVSVELTNLGTVSIWEPKPVMLVNLFGADGVSTKTWDRWGEAFGGGNSGLALSVIDSGETATFTTYHEVPKAIWATEYEVFITDSDGVKWKRSKMISNRAASSEQRVEPSCS